MSVIANELGGQTVRFVCWDAQLTKGDRFGLTQALLPFPGDEQSFLSPFPARSTYSEILQTRYVDQTRAIQQDCGSWAGELELRERPELDQIELRCTFLTNTILIDTNDDFIADGEVAKGSTVSKVLGKFLISELKQPSPGLQPNRSNNQPTSSQPVSANSLRGYVIEGIEVKVLNRRSNQLTSLEQRENPYGLDMDLLIMVKVKGTTGDLPSAAANLLLAIHAPGYDYPATGPVSDWNIVHTRPLKLGSHDGTSYFFPFLVDYQCYPKVQLTATIVQAESANNASFFQSLNLGCAE
ncbi:MAG: hypothetical protein HC934_06310 [Acaryochloridaceae cyanobacterium SU_2_1]|nr:hypothetical protein [Acaryochloridaceae cyanobacterium SU_2_1]